MHTVKFRGEEDTFVLDSSENWSHSTNLFVWFTIACMSALWVRHNHPQCPEPTISLHASQ
ncbi:hypothetical protein FA13DRAFT_171427 [Coprinellus micaceus]|uniref:Uncharacterized protein n=1 Tax=Coprinellus micaceus TaxID=71717 RepID=A0A4Y7SHF4_COPMI|nr:hypothetical protein FA13DRAFT_171427 [Coprinellus micaceus]